MKLSDLSPQERAELAKKVKKNEVYIYQCSTGFRNPSAKLARNLVAADPRLTLEELRPDIWGVAVEVDSKVDSESGLHENAV